MYTEHAPYCAVGCVWYTFVVSPCWRIGWFCIERSRGRNYTRGQARWDQTCRGRCGIGLWSPASMLRQLISGVGCTDDVGPSGRANPLQSLYTDLHDRSKHHEYLPEVRFSDAAVADLAKEKIRTRSHIHLRHVFPGMQQHELLRSRCKLCCVQRLSPHQHMAADVFKHYSVSCRCQSTSIAAAAKHLSADSEYF